MDYFKHIKRTEFKSKHTRIGLEIYRDLYKQYLPNDRLVISWETLQRLKADPYFYTHMSASVIIGNIRERIHVAYYSQNTDLCIHEPADNLMWLTQSEFIQLTEDALALPKEYCNDNQHNYTFTNT